MTGIIVDAHCDTITKIMRTGEDLGSNRGHVDLDRMREYGGYVQFFAAFIDAAKIRVSPIIEVLRIIDSLCFQIEKFKDKVEIVLCLDDIFRVVNDGKVAALISIEGGEALQGDLSVLRMLYRLGVRSVCLTWNHKNEIGCGALEEIDTGLSRFGHEVVSEMNKIGMIIDVSHLNELGFWHVINHSKSPIIASHSNAKGICGHKRNLSDQQIKALAQNNGVMGINYYPLFLNSSRTASIDDVLRHIEYVSAIVGTEYIGLGGDFDGIEVVPKGVEDVSKVVNILNELAKRNYTQQQIDNIAGGNMLRVIKEVVG